MKCRFCKSDLKIVFADLGMSPLANSFIKSNESNLSETFFPLKTFVCDNCFLVQLGEFKSPRDIFKNYAYFSSFSKTWLEHANEYVELLVNRFNLNKKSLVVEIASNDGYLLQFFKSKNIPVLGIEPAENVAKSAIEKGIPTLKKVFDSYTAKEFKKS